MMERDFYLGRILTGRISSGIINVGDKLHAIHSTDDGVQKIEEGKVYIFTFYYLSLYFLLMKKYQVWSKIFLQCFIIQKTQSNSH